MTTFANPFSILFPGAGGNLQSFDTSFFSPNVSVNFAGNRAVEREVNEDVASYGRQIGWLNDIVAALAAAAPDALKADPAAAGSLKKLGAAQEKIEAIKQRRKADAYDSAREALSRLGASDKDGYRRLVKLLNPDQPPGAS